LGARGLHSAFKQAFSAWRMNDGGGSSPMIFDGYHGGSIRLGGSGWAKSGAA
jgi:hypothetical protein